MSKRIDAQITCPHCQHRFNYTLFRSIWGEYPENRELVMSDKINVATCPICNVTTKLPFPFIYTNAEQHFAVWWEPEFDLQIGKDCEGYVQMLGPGNYLATAPRIKDWKEFKNTILKFERGELKGKAGEITSEMQGQMQDFLKHIKKENNEQKSGCLGSFVLIIGFGLGIAYGISTLLS